MQNSISRHQHHRLLRRTPANLDQLNQQRKQIQNLQNQSLSSVVAEQMLEKFIKSTEVAMQDAVLLRQGLHLLRTSNKHQREKKNLTRAFIQHGGSLIGDEGLQRLREREVQEEPQSRSRRLARCSNCNQETILDESALLDSNIIIKFGMLQHGEDIT